MIGKNIGMMSEFRFLLKGRNPIPTVFTIVWIIGHLLLQARRLGTGRPRYSRVRRMWQPGLASSCHSNKKSHTHTTHTMALLQFPCFVSYYTQEDSSLDYNISIDVSSLIGETYSTSGLVVWSSLCSENDISGGQHRMRRKSAKLVCVNERRQQRR